MKQTSELTNELVSCFNRMETWYVIETLQIKKRAKYLGEIINRL